MSFFVKSFADYLPHPSHLLFTTRGKCQQGQDLGQPDPAVLGPGLASLAPSFLRKPSLLFQEQVLNQICKTFDKKMTLKRAIHKERSLEPLHTVTRDDACIKKFCLHPSTLDKDRVSRDAVRFPQDSK